MVDAILAAVREAGEMMRIATNPAVHTKAGHFNYVTEADIAVQDLLKARLLVLLPGSEFFAEEKRNAALSDAATWMVDPIDGTQNFIRGRQASAVSVCLLRGGAARIGVIYNPYTEALFHAVDGGGAFCNGTPIRVSDTPFDQALVGLGTAPYRADLAAAGLTAAYRFLRGAGDLRRSGSAAIDLTDVACGRLDIMFELELSPWDVAAGSLLVTEAGGVFGMPWQADVSFAGPSCVLAANPTCYPHAADILRAVRHIHATQ